jgi:hypothetical protein
VRHAALSQAEYKALGYAKLLAELKRMLAQADRQMKWFDVQARQRILVALMAMKELTHAEGRRTDIHADLDKPDYEEVLLLLGLNAARVRKWKQRSASERDIRYLVGEERPQRMRREAAVTDADFRNAVEMALRMSAAILDGDYVKAEQLAERYEERYGEDMAA